jgi:hypothetical protein
MERMERSLSDADRSREAADTLWVHGLDTAATDDPLTSEYARAALAELERLQAGTPGVLQELLEGGADER